MNSDILVTFIQFFFSNSQSPPRHQARGESHQGQQHSKAVAAAFNCESNVVDLSRSQTLAIAEESPSALVSPAEHHLSGLGH